MSRDLRWLLEAPSRVTDNTQRRQARREECAEEERHQESPGNRLPRYRVGRHLRAQGDRRPRGGARDTCYNQEAVVGHDQGRQCRGRRVAVDFEESEDQEGGARRVSGVNPSSEEYRVQ